MAQVPGSGTALSTVTPRLLLLGESTPTATGDPLIRPLPCIVLAQPFSGSRLPLIWPMMVGPTFRASWTGGAGAGTGEPIDRAGPVLVEDHHRIEQHIRGADAGKSGRALATVHPEHVERARRFAHLRVKSRNTRFVVRLAWSPSSPTLYAGVAGQEVVRRVVGGGGVATGGGCHQGGRQQSFRRLPPSQYTILRVPCSIPPGVATPLTWWQY
ncbi:MAG: hypothetical protein U5L05_15215 [Rubrivivax sp.]|nr:hypothetical protein [Rubrivivax sp.]